MNLNKSYGNTVIKNMSKILNPLEGVEIDYYFMAQGFAGSKEEISLRLWTVIIDSQGQVYCMCTYHIGHFNPWKAVIRDRMESHLQKVGVDNLQISRMLREIQIKKEGHIIPWDYRVGGNRVGIDGSDEIYIRRDRFTYI